MAHLLEESWRRGSSTEDSLDLALGSGRRRNRLAGAGPSDSRSTGGFWIRAGRAPPDVVGRPRRALNEKRLELRGEVRALICREVCIPGRAEVSLSVPVQDDAPAANPKVAALFNRAESRLPVEIPSSWRLSAAQSGDQILLRISGTSVAAGAMFFPGSANQVE